MHGKPIIFNADMVRAILEGRKTQTRRIVKFPKDLFPNGAIRDLGFGDGEYLKVLRDSDATMHRLRCPYGYTGNELWVRETFAYYDPEYFSGRIVECPSANQYPSHYEDYIGGCTTVGIAYKAEEGLPDCSWEFEEDLIKWNPSIFMPRWASRIQLKIKDVRVERLQYITKEDALAEGIMKDLDGHGYVYDNQGRGYSDDPRESFLHLWESINAKRGFGWDVNPWVWVIEFERIKRRR